MTKSAAVFVVACVLAVVGCDDELAGARAGGDSAVELPVEVDSGAALPLADAGAALPLADAAPELADAALTPDAASDAGAPVLPVADAGAPVSEPPRCATKFYRDADGDSFGDPATALASCSKPDGYVDNALDCYDANKLAYPGQKGRLAEHRGDGSFDYDCDGVERKLLDKLATCPAFTAEDNACRPTWEKPVAGEPTQANNCTDIVIAKVNAMREGWWLVVPACGEIGQTGYHTPWTREAGYTCVGVSTARMYQSCN